VEKWGWRAPTSPKAIPGFPAGQVGSAVGALFINNSNLQKSNDLVKGQVGKRVENCLAMFADVSRCERPNFSALSSSPLDGILVHPEEYFWPSA
jgi:hypothetical protein